MDLSCKCIHMYGNETDYLIRFNQGSLLASGCSQTKVLEANQVSTNRGSTFKNLMNVGSGFAEQLEDAVVVVPLH